MTLREKFAEFTKQESWEKENYNAKECEQIADDYAIEFGDWIGKNAITYHNGKFRMKTLTPVFRTSEQLLERFKIEKGL